ncbi:MAG: hypothetical protein JWM77_1473 [Rhodospirillales bacterium]|nr:hypothetical protein [Rhodospirillales bacterium]
MRALMVRAHQAMVTRVLLPRLLLLTALGTLGSTSELGTGPDPSALGWQRFQRPGYPDAVIEPIGETGFRLIADGAFGMRWQRLPVATVTGHCVLHWRWRALAAPPPSDPRTKGRDDRPLAVHVGFAQPGFLDRLGMGAPFDGKLLTYQLGGLGTRGEIVPNPHLPQDGVVILLRPGEIATGAWFDEAVDWQADHARAFGSAPAEPPAVLAISIDTDDLGGIARAEIDHLRIVCD